MSGSKSTDLFSGTELRDAGIALANNHANATITDWSEKSMLALKTYLSYHKQGFCCDDLVKYAEDLGLVPPPPDRRAWGYIMVAAAKQNLIKKIGYMERSDPKHHRGIATAWIDYNAPPT